jgi:hypothetical protein
LACDLTGFKKYIFLQIVSAKIISKKDVAVLVMWRLLIAGTTLIWYKS